MLFKKIVMITATIYLLVVIMVAFNGAVSGLLTKTVTLSGVGTVVYPEPPSPPPQPTISIKIYGDSGCSNEVSSIDWGTIEAGSTKDVIVFVRNEGDVAVTLYLEATNWDPSAASNYITLSWNYVGQSISPNEVIPVTLKLSVSSNIQGITSFTFDIVITASE